MARNAKKRPIFDDKNSFSRKYQRPIKVTNTSLIKSHMIFTDVSVSVDKEKYTIMGCSPKRIIGISKYHLGKFPSYTFFTTGNDKESSNAIPIGNKNGLKGILDSTNIIMEN